MSGDATRWVLSAVGGGAVPVSGGRPVTAGRSPECDLCVPGDGRLSRVQFSAAATAGGVVVRDETGGRTPLFADGERVEGRRTLTARVALAAGRTRFRLTPPRPPGDEREGADAGLTVGSTLDGGTLTFDARTLAAVPVTRPDLRLEALTRLPEVLRTAGDARGAVLCGLILAGTPDAAAVALIEPDRTAGGGFAAADWTARDELTGPPTVPADVVGPAMRTGNATLGRGDAVGGRAGDAGWAFCVPIPPSDDGPAVAGLLVAGDGGRGGADPRERTADVRFAALVAEAVAAADRSARLERQAAALRPFLPPRVLADLGDDPDPARLAPVECTATVLFCDLRGFSRTSEELAGDLPRLLARVSAALTVMTGRIREFGGVTGDFLGDAALAFWGWPEDDPEAPVKAARAALGIAADFHADRPARDAAGEPDPLAGFRVGVGVATGPAVAGRIGTEEQAKITVFGPVANLASRLEGLCGPLRAPVVCDAATAHAVRGAAGVRVRPLATVRPAKMDRAEAVSELLPPAGSHPLSDADLARYADAVAAFTAGDWPRAADLLQDHPSSDLAQDFLRVRLAEHHRTAPPGWDGAVRVDAK